MAAYGRMNCLMVIEFAFDPPVSDAPNRPFPDEIASNPWVLYHGTSGEAESQIDAHGFSRTGSPFKKADLQAVVDIFDELGWAGCSGSSLAVLRPFSLEHDFGDSAQKPIFFAECAYRAITFASHDFSGGETARSLRYCFAELWKYLQDESNRESHLAKIRREMVHCPQNGYLPRDLPCSDLESVRSRVEALAPLRDLADGFKDRHEYGVVYAVRFSRDDLNSLTYHDTMGMKCFSDVSAEQIVGKTRIPSAYKQPWLTIDWLQLPPCHGIIANAKHG